MAGGNQNGGVPQQSPYQRQLEVSERLGLNPPMFRFRFGGGQAPTMPQAPQAPGMTSGQVGAIQPLIKPASGLRPPNLSGGMFGGTNVAQPAVPQQQTTAAVCPTCGKPL